MIADAIYRSRLRTQSDKKLMFLMLGCSLMLHAGVVLVAKAEWGFSLRKTHFSPAYSVELVTLPATSAKKYPKLGTSSKSRATVRQKQGLPIRRFRSKEQSLSLRKKQRNSAPSSEQEEVKLAEEVLTKIERSPPPPTAVEKKTAKVEGGQAAAGRKKVSLVNIGGMEGSELSQALVLYRALVNEKIENNWVLPERLNQEKDKLEAIVVVRARRDGSIFDIHFEKKSGDSYFDDSVLKAILKSKPFPPFPDIYSPREEEIVIRFAPANVSS